MSFGSAIADYYVSRFWLAVLVGAAILVGVAEGARYLLHHLDVYVLWN